MICYDKISFLSLFRFSTMEVELLTWITKAHSGTAWSLWGTPVAVTVLSWSRMSTSETMEPSPVTPRTHLTLPAAPPVFDCWCLRRVTDHYEHFCLHSLIKKLFKKWLLCRETCYTRKPFGFLLCFLIMPQLLRLIFAFRLILFQGGIHNLGDLMAGDESLLLMEAQNNSKAESWVVFCGRTFFQRVQYLWKIAIVGSKCLTQS